MAKAPAALLARGLPTARRAPDEIAAPLPATLERGRHGGGSLPGHPPTYRRNRPALSDVGDTPRRDPRPPPQAPSKPRRSPSLPAADPRMPPSDSPGGILGALSPRDDRQGSAPGALSPPDVPVQDPRRGLRSAINPCTYLFRLPTPALPFLRPPLQALFWRRRAERRPRRPSRAPAALGASRNFRQISGTKEN